MAGPARAEQFIDIDINIIWYLVTGALLISMGLMESVLKRMPLSPAMCYLPVGYLLGPSGVGMVNVDASQHAGILTTATEIALLISLFTVGLKMRVSLRDPIWWLPLRLGFIAMVISVGLLTAVGVWLLNLPLGAAVLLAAILSPTDPVLASDVQLQNVGDRDRIRFGLSGEGGMNDGSTFPFVMLGLGLLAVPEARKYAEPGAFGLAIYGVVAGAAVGWVLGWCIAKLVIHLRRRHQSALGMEEFLTLGLIALSYSAAHLVHGIGFVAVFATGVAVRRTESSMTGGQVHPEKVIGAVPVGQAAAQVATDPAKAPAYMTEMVLGFNQQLEHIAEFAMVLLVGVMISVVGLSKEGLLVACVLFLVVRPVSVTLALAGSSRSAMQVGLMSWFGIRGIGSLYYLAFALQYHWLPELTTRFTTIVVTVIALSIVVHGVSSTPLMDRYYRTREARKQAEENT